MPDAITVYDTDDCQLTEKVRKIAELRGDGVSMNDVVREHLRGPVQRELREWERAERRIHDMDRMQDEDLEDMENELLDMDYEGRLSTAETYLLDKIQAELKRRSTPTIG